MAEAPSKPTRRPCDICGREAVAWILTGPKTYALKRCDKHFDYHRQINEQG